MDIVGRIEIRRLNVTLNSQINRSDVLTKDTSERGLGIMVTIAVIVGGAAGLVAGGLREGPQGYRGPEGPRGPYGHQGIQGLEGIQGMPGEQGIRGKIGPGLSVGSIIAFGGAATPTGWVLCDGSSISRSTYTELFGVLGTSWGEGDGMSTFNLPDLRGRFLRGVDSPNGQEARRDPDWRTRRIGSVQEDSTRSHSHRAGNMIAQINPSGGEVPLNTGSQNWVARKCLKGIRAAAPDDGNDQMNSGVVVSGNTSTDILLRDGETRPENCAVNFIIKH